MSLEVGSACFSTAISCRAMALRRGRTLVSWHLIFIGWVVHVMVVLVDCYGNIGSHLIGQA